MTGKTTNILLAGVGGQGILIAAGILSQSCMMAGFQVKKSEIHGMSQRGGSVLSQVRFGAAVFSPIVPEGEGDLLVGFELMESCRLLPLLKPGATVVANDLRIPPPSVLMGQEPYPDDLAQRIARRCPDFILVDGQRLALEAGHPAAANTLLLGALSGRLEIAEEIWLESVGRMVPKKALEANLRAFRTGRSLAGRG